jgi:uncharacterized damage-inducible protein DinB
MLEEPSRMTEMNRIVRMLNKAFSKGAWHGPTVREVLAQVTASQAHLRAGRSHSILELVLHMTSWRIFTAKRLRGDGVYQVTDDLNFPSPDSITWEDAIKKLEESHVELVEAAKAFPEERLGELVPTITHKYTYYTLLHGIIQHDIYHIGQIQLILRANASA